ncbi:MAG TPA: RsmG family class I SAM-dependent methyltransferase [Candidatus Binataceae bacterium]|nr:RsmG family class I SAM-dependent methyltransferase [Candidatus Binataceae bacterium]
MDARFRAALEAYHSDPALAALLGERFMRRMETFVSALGVWGEKVNLTARPNDPSETAFHIVDSLMPLIPLSTVFATGKRILDLGSGAGFPGIVLASACSARFTLAEARRKRVSFLKVVAAEMALENVEILATRLSAASVTPSFDAVISRASGPPAEFYAVAASALVPSGLAILYSSPSQRLDLTAATSAGLSDYHRYRYSLHRGAADSERIEHILAVWQKPVWKKSGKAS